MNQQRIITCTLVASIFGCTALHAAPAPAPTPTTAPADQDPAPKAAMVTFVRAMMTGDEKGVFEALVFSDPASDPIAHAIFAPQMARQRLQKALAAAFPESADVKDMGITADDIKGAEKDISDATLIISGDSATLTMKDGGEKMFLIKKNGAWKIDFDKTQKDMGPPPSKAQLAESAAQVQVLDSVAADVAAKKYKSLDDVKADMDKRMTAAMAAQQPGTAPAATSAPKP